MTDFPTILILAGKRDGKLDPLADRAGVSHKCRVPIQGQPLLQWVLQAVGPAFADRPILISIHDPEVIADIPEVQALTAAGRLHICEAKAGIVESVEAAAAHPAMQWPMLITTGDNVLVTAEALHEVHEDAQAQGADAMLSLAEKSTVLAAHPEGQRGYYDFRDIAIANCNAYWLRNPNALGAAEAFREGGQFMSNRARIARAFGLFNLIGFRFGWWTLQGAMRRMSRRFGMTVRAHIFADGAYAIDVDNERTYSVCETLLAKRKPRA